ncbi:MAG: ComEC/Rec2 family competence protein [bacterium]|nr:ComEC/Rec2 family competence protein [bacterium]
MVGSDISPHSFFVWGALGIIGGTAVSGLGATTIQVLGVILVMCVVSRTYAYAPLVVVFGVCMVIGSAYYLFDDYTYYHTQSSLRSKTAFDGRVLAPPVVRNDRQSFFVGLADSKGKILINTSVYPAVSYGDRILIEGSVRVPLDGSYARYLKKEHVHGTISWPKMNVIEPGGNMMLRALFFVREYAVDVLGTHVTYEQSAFISGILFGDRSSFTDEFIEKLSTSGTMHLTALSGLHMSIIVFALFAICTVVLPGRKGKQIAVAFTIVALFVAMTGFKVSAMRAALMAFLVNLASFGGRTYDALTAIILAALILVIVNPMSVVYDLGFQLSFAAVLSIVYFSPVIQRFPFFSTPGFLGWRSVLAITLAAQVGVFPITIYQFANFSFSALPANIAILLIMPILMGLGALTILFGTLSAWLGALVAMPTAFLTDYALTIIDIFSQVRIPFNPHMGFLGSIVYYALLVWICVRNILWQRNNI